MVIVGGGSRRLLGEISDRKFANWGRRRLIDDSHQKWRLEVGWLVAIAGVG